MGVNKAEAEKGAQIADNLEGTSPPYMTPLDGEPV